MDKFHDSAGVPWEGREFSQNPFASDDGSTPVELARVLNQETLDKQELFVALESSRLLIPLLADLGEGEVGPHGQMVDKSADLSVVAVSTPDKQTALPVFASVADMSSWNSVARPVPIDPRRVALAAIAEGHTRVILNPATRPIAIRRPMLAALAQQKSWTNPARSEWVKNWVGQVAMNQPLISSVDLFDGDPLCNLSHAELTIQLGLRPKISPDSLKQLLTDFTQDLQTEQFQEVVDSIAYRLVTS